MTIVKGRELSGIKRETINDLFWNTVEQYPDIEAVRYRTGEDWSGITYRELGNHVEKLALGLLALGLEKGDKISLLSETRYEWVLADFAVLSAAGVVVTIYPTLNARTVRYIIENSDSKIVIVENSEQLDKVLSVWKKLPDLKYIVTLEDLKEKPAKNIYTLGELSAMGEQHGAKNPSLYKDTLKSVEPSDLSSIVYTSGTTGMPKGTMLSHWNWRFNVYAVVDLVDFDPGDTLLAFLPLSHVYMRLVYFAAVNAGATTYFSLPDSLAQDLPLVRPHCFVSVPRLFERVYGRLMEQIGSGPVLRKSIFHWAAAVAREVGETHSRWEEPSAMLKIKHRLADKLVFSKIRERMGVDRLRWTCSSGSSLRKDLAHFFNGIGIMIIEGYGMTEVAAPSNLNPVGRFKPGTVGPPLAGVMEKIANDGEILIKGDNVMMGYYKMPEETKEHFTEDGWLKTGDIGRFDEDNYLVFTERKKHILVLSTGKNVPPLPIEEELKKNRYIDEAVVIGDNEKFVSALIQPNYNMLLKFARERKIAFNEDLTEYALSVNNEEVPVRVDEALLKNEIVLELYQKAVNRANKPFNNFEQVRAYKLLGDTLTMEKGELTPTFKVKRDTICEEYADLIREIYA